MIKYRIFFLTIALCQMMFVSCTLDEPESKNSDWNLTGSIELTRSEEQTVANINEIGFRLMETASSLSEDGEFCISPVSISIYLGMLANATAGECHEQILQALGAEDINDLNTLSRKLLQYLPCDENESSLSINNHFWIAKHNKAPKSFVSIMNHYFNAGVDYVDFKKESTVGKINSWVSDRTEGIIPGIIYGDLESYKDREMVSANTVYFKGDWAERFLRDNTELGKFRTPDGYVDTYMMHQTLNAFYHESEFARSIELRFEGSQNAMYVHLPSEGTDLNQLIRKLSSSEMFDDYHPDDLYTVTLSMPKFNKYSESDINGMLREVGITSLGNADLSPMGLKTIPQNLIHNVSIKVDETGAELAAVTANTGETANVPNQYKNITLDIDRPFVYILKNRETGAILMAGVVTDPR